ncbi:hypothetical protein E5Q_05675 [Mixia osmundae IAM 14324]|uniref:Major facilitator superfamily (MFS) profile domain-containing protein n=1 Tax=Mixia osmundae (strain CBS 9802 / IAM 14324 / JCM 22182 / KY 12970) TaxID=764103 RepID=G7E826_MIXOS|nr:hypothetical protein E5Q_05675 [Mixia osmundae IAM 14324]
MNSALGEWASKVDAPVVSPATSDGVSSDKRLALEPSVSAAVGGHLPGITASTPRTRQERLSAAFTIACAGFALISDGYQNNVMTLLNVVYKRIYPTVYTSSVSTRVSNSLLVGAILGQVIVGVVCDRVGRKAAIIGATLCIVIGAALSTAAHGANGSAEGLFWFLTFSRGLTGIGVGAEYPASSTSAAEAANESMLSQRGPIFILVTNLPLSFGGPLAVSIFLIVYSCTSILETLWRVIFGIGILFPLVVFYFRLKMLHSKLYRTSAIKRRVPYMLSLKRYWRRLIGTAGCWFLYDFVTFPNGVFSSTIIASVVKDASLKRTAEWQLLLGSLALPGVFLGAYLCNKLGRKYTMILGFSGYLIFGLIIGCSFDRIIKIVPLFVIFYGLLQSSGNAGPGDMLGLVSSELYPTPIRGTAYGLSACIGKTGAAVGTQVFTPIQNHWGKRWTFIVAAIVGILGVLNAYIFLPNVGGEDLAKEDEAFAEYLAANGWTGEVGEDDGKNLIGAKEEVVRA